MIRELLVVGGMKRTMDEKMTKSERVELGQLIRKRERVMKCQASERAAQMLAEFDAGCAAIYSFDDDEVWKKSNEEAEKVVAEANLTIQTRCKDGWSAGKTWLRVGGLNCEEWLSRGLTRLSAKRGQRSNA